MSTSPSGRYNWVANDPKAMTSAFGKNSTILSLMLNKMNTLQVELLQLLGVAFLGGLDVVKELYYLVMKSQQRVFDVLGPI